MNWYYAEDGAQKGPVSEAQFQALVQAGTIQADTLVWHEGMADWKTYQEVTSPTVEVVTEPVVGTAGTAVAINGEVEEPDESFDPQKFLQNMRDRGGYSIDIGAVISRGWDVMSANLALSIGVCLLVMVLQMLASFVPFIGSLAQVFLSGPFTGGLCFLFLLLVRGQPARFEDAFAGFVQPRFLKLMLTGFILAVIQVVVMLIFLIPIFVAVPGLAAAGVEPESVAAFSPLLILWIFVAMIPMVFLSLIWCLTYIVIVDTGLAYWEAMEFSRKIVMMRFWSWLLFFIVCGVLMLAGTMVLCVGILIAMPVVAGAFAKAWDDIVVAARNLS